VARDGVAESLRAQLDALDLTLPFVTDTGRIRRELGYGEVTAPADALQRTIEHEARHATI
jgi:hypothetical protein